MSLRERLVYCGLLVAILAIAVTGYWSGLNGIFLVDDIYNLNTLNANGGVTDWPSFLAFVFGNNSGMLGRPVAMLSFLINDQYYPGSVFDYRYTNLMIHCLCGVLVFSLLRQLVMAVEKGKERVATQVAIACAAFWLLMPLNVSTTLYIIQRMTQLAALFSLAGLCLFIYGRQLVAKGENFGRIWILIGLYGFGGLAVLSKESGALIFGFALVTELAIAYGRKEKSDPFVLFVIVLPLLLGVAYLLVKWRSLTHSSVRDFNTLERLMTESRLLWDYFSKTLFPISGKMGLVHDDIVISRGLFEPLSTIFSILLHALTITVVWLLRKRYVWLFWGVAGFYVGHMLESTVIPLELYFEHRNYLPGVFLASGLVTFIWLQQPNWAKIGLCALIALSAVVCFQRAEIWGNPKAQIYIWAQEHPDSIRAQTMYARSLIAEKNYPAAEAALHALQDKWPEYIHNDLVILNHSCADKMTLNFTQAELFRKMERGVYDGSLPSIFEETFRLYKVGRCDWLDDALMAELFERVYTLKNAAHTFKAKVAYWEVEFYARQGDLGRAIEAIDKTFKHQRDSFVLFVKSGMLHSAGLHEMALEEVDKAIAMEEQKAGFLQTYMENYLTLRTRIVSHLEGAPSVK